MSITRAPSKYPPKTVDDFIAAAPDGAKASKVEAPDSDGVQITLRLSKEQLNRITHEAKRQGIARASYIKRAVFLQLEADETR